MSDETKQKLETLANELDEIADNLWGTNVPVATKSKLRDCVEKLCEIARS